MLQLKRDTLGRRKTVNRLVNNLILGLQLQITSHFCFFELPNL